MDDVDKINQLQHDFQSDVMELIDMYAEKMAEEMPDEFQYDPNAYTTQHVLMFQVIRDFALANFKNATGIEMQHYREDFTHGNTIH